MPGNMVVVEEGRREAQAGLLATPGAVDDMLYELVDEAVFFAADRLKVHAPGGIGELVDVSLPDSDAGGHLQGVAGVLPDLAEGTFHRGLGSDPADYPVFVDQGTGVYGEHHLPIQTVPGNLMGPIPYDGRFIYARSFKGQPAQHFSLHSFEDTVGWLPGRVELAVRSASVT